MCSCVCVCVSLCPRLIAGAQGRDERPAKTNGTRPCGRVDHPFDTGCGPPPPCLPPRSPCPLLNVCLDRQDAARSERKVLGLFAWSQFPLGGGIVREGSGVKFDAVSARPEAVRGDVVRVPLWSVGRALFLPGRRAMRKRPADFLGSRESHLRSYTNRAFAA